MNPRSASVSWAIRRPSRRTGAGDGRRGRPALAACAQLTLRRDTRAVGHRELVAAL